MRARSAFPALVIAAAVLAPAGSAGAGPSDSASATRSCQRAFPFNRTYARVVSVSVHLGLSCRQATRIGEDALVLYVHGRIPTPSLPPLPLGVPGGKSRPFKVNTRWGVFTCVMTARGSDFIDASCTHNGRNVVFDGNTHQIR